MATITSRKRKEGMRYSAQIRIKRNGKVVHTETETFDKKSLAKEWAARRESELKVPGVLEQVRHEGVSVQRVLEWYRDDYDGKSKFGRSKLSHIEYLINHPTFSSLDAIKLTSSQLVAHITQRRRNGAGASTANNDLVWLRNAFRAVRIGRGIQWRTQPPSVQSAHPPCSSGLVRDDSG